MAMKNYEINVLKYTRTKEAKELAKKRSEKYRQTHKDKIKEHNKTTYNTIQKRARKKYSNGIRDGKIKPLNYCEICGEREAIEAHHFDYNYPLSIIHLCNQHHKDIHKYFNLINKKYGTYKKAE